MWPFVPALPAPQGSNPSTKSQAPHASPSYMAPELYASDGGNAVATASLPSALDVYSFGWLLWDLCHDGLPAFGAAAQDGVAQPPALETAHSGPVRKSLDGIWILLQVPCPALHVFQCLRLLAPACSPFRAVLIPVTTKHITRSDRSRRTRWR